MNAVTDARDRSQARLPIFSRLEREVIRLGLRDGEQTLRRADGAGNHAAFAARRPFTPPLEALRMWVELARARVPPGPGLSTTTLSDAGYSPIQIAEVQRLVAAATLMRDERS